MPSPTTRPLACSRRLCSQHGTVHSSHLPHSRTSPALSKHLVSEEGDSVRHLSRGDLSDLFRLRRKFGDDHFHPRGPGVVYKNHRHHNGISSAGARVACAVFLLRALACLSSPYLLLHPCVCLPCCLFLTRWVAFGFGEVALFWDRENTYLERPVQIMIDSTSMCFLRFMLLPFGRPCCGCTSIDPPVCQVTTASP